MTRKTSQSGIDLIKKFEGVRLVGYRCVAGRPTVGVGHCGPEVTVGMQITQEECDRLLAQDLAKFEAAVNGAVKVNISQNQFDALVSLAFNIGVSAFKASTLVKALNQGKYADAAERFGQWIHAGSAVIPGLIRRRAAERDLFLSPPLRRHA